MKSTDNRSRRFIFGKNPVLEALKSDQEVTEVWIEKSSNKKLEQISQMCIESKIPCFFKDSTELENLEQDYHQGIIAFLGESKNLYYSIEQFFSKSAPKPPYFFIILDSITDPRNFGAIIRNCDHFNITGVLFSQDRSAQISPLVYKASSGAAHFVPLIQVKNLSRAMSWMKKQNIWIYGLDVTGDSFLPQVQFSGDIALVLGSEEKGMRRLVKESCDHLIKIENIGHVDSLNVSVASGIAMYEVLKQRSKNA